ncbi:type VI secretion system protein TssA [Neisseria subflava]|jgi:type VI secretion-associated protein, VC_A0119 family|nr:type VI secretion system protein TssA [Neisseria subflava]
MTLPQWVKPILGDEGTSITDNNIHRWQEWLEPVSDGHPCGEDVAYADDFEAIKIELAKLSGIDCRLILDASERLLKRQSKDLRVATYYIFAALRDRGLAGFSDGLEILCGLLQKFDQSLWPKKPVQKRNALNWLSGERVLDTLKGTELSNSVDLKRTLSALMSLQHHLEGWEESVRPSLFPLLQYFEESSVRFSSPQTGTSQSQEVSTPIDQEVVPQIRQEGQRPSESLAVTQVNSSKALLDQVRINAAYLREQDDGYWPAYKMIRAVRWGGLNGTPPHQNGQTRLKAPRTDLLATLNRLVNEQQWRDLLDRVEAAFLEGANQYWLDLQYYAWQGQQALGGLYLSQVDSSLFELKSLLTRCDGLTGLSFDNGFPFVSADTLTWLEQKVMPSTRKQTSSRTVQKAVIESSSQVENQESQWQQALLKTQEQGLDAAFAWLETLPELKSGAGQVKKWLMMARLAANNQKADWALKLLEQASRQMQVLTVKEWDKHFAFDVYALWYQLLNENLDKKDTEATGQLEFLRTELMQADIVRALELID